MISCNGEASSTTLLALLPLVNPLFVIPFLPQHLMPSYFIQCCLKDYHNPQVEALMLMVILLLCNSSFPGTLLGLQFWVLLHVMNFSQEFTAL